MLKIICDLCGKEISDENELECRNFKIKERKGYFDVSSWCRIDAHPRCIRKLLDGSKLSEEPPMGGSCMTDD